MISSTLVSDLQNSFEAIISSIVPNVNSSLIRNSADALYAAYVFGLILRAVDQVADPGSIRLRSINSSWLTASLVSPPVFVVRGAPGYIYSSGQDYGYAEFAYAGQAHEIHLGVRYFGSSSVLHEFDISILDSIDGNRCRQDQESPSSGKPRAIFECKFYDRNVGIELGREFVGLLADFRGVPIARLVTNSDSLSVRAYLRKKNRPKFNGQIDPSNSQMETEFINAVADDIRTRLR